MPVQILVGLTHLLRTAKANGASDVHLLRGAAPSQRVDGRIIRLEGEPLTAEAIERLLEGLLDDRMQARLRRYLDLDFSFDHPELGRFRASVFYERGSLSAAFRLVPWEVRSLEELGLPQVIHSLVRKPDGLVLVTGAVGMGKTTTLSTMIDLINEERPVRIVTIEDPIEYLHTHKKGMIFQREVRADARSFNRALVAALRQDPNVIAIGQMRDYRTISTALTAAETGHLVLSTLHTQDAVHTVERIIDVFPPHQHPQVRLQLANTLQGVIYQKLLPRTTGKGRVLAYEVMIATPAARRLIREGKADQIPNVLTTGREQGMISMDQCIQNLYMAQDISFDTARLAFSNPDQLKEAQWEPAR